MDTIGAEDQEWEFEYNENETEEFYIVLELPSESALKPQSKADDLFAAHDPTQPRKKATRIGKKRRRNAAAEDEDEEEVDDEAHPAHPELNADGQHSELPNIQTLNLNTAIEKPSNFAPNGLQIMDFESDEPMIMYQGQIYSCRWASSIGSDVLFIRPDDDSSLDYKPLHSFQEVNILGIGAAKLVASPAAIERRQDFMPQSNLDSPVPSANVTIQSEDVLRQASFLARVADIKAGRGEPVGNLRTLAESVHRNPENLGADGKQMKRGRGARVRASGRAKAISTQTMATVDVTPSRRSSSARRQSASTPTPASWAELDEAMGEEGS